MILVEHPRFPLAAEQLRLCMGKGEVQKASSYMSQDARPFCIVLESLHLDSKLRIRETEWHF